jgi:hypothetical protein
MPGAVETCTLKVQPVAGRFRSHRRFPLESLREAAARM